MTIFDEQKIKELTDSQIKKSKEKLHELDVFCGREPELSGLNGWVFEQVIQYCLRKELEEKGLRNVIISEQYKLGSRAIIDFKIADKIVVEIKRSGIFYKKEQGSQYDDRVKYRRYRDLANQQGFTYLYITAKEQTPKKGKSENYKETTRMIFDRENTFFLDEPGDWERFVNRVIEVLKQPERV